jgi:hypothetical protein
MGKTKKADIEYPFEHGEVINYSSVTTKIQTPFLPQLPGGRRQLMDFTMRPMVTLKQLQGLKAVIGENWMDQQHCSYATILT